MDPSAYCLPIRVYFQDTDAGGVVFHGSYVNFLERARTEWLRERYQIDATSLLSRFGIAFVIRELHLQYFKPARLDDLLQVTVELSHMGRSRLVFLQQIWCGNEKISEAEVDVVCVTLSSFKSCAIPDELRTQWMQPVGNS